MHSTRRGATVIKLLLLVLACSGLITTLLGTFTLWHLLRSKKAPADASNRINHIRLWWFALTLWWFALTREDKFVGQFPWMKNDEWENVRK